jgi:hypothetical protein
MNADALLEIMRAGGKVEERWKRRWLAIGKPRKQVILTHPDGTRQIIQRSCVSPLIKRGLVYTEHWSGDEYVYRLAE